jgi:hypothetical protein
MIGVFVGFSRIFLLGVLIFKGLSARRFYKSFGFKGLVTEQCHVLYFTHLWIEGSLMERQVLLPAIRTQSPEQFTDCLDGPVNS